MFSENREKTLCFSQGTTFLQVLEALGRVKAPLSLSMAHDKCYKRTALLVLPYARHGPCTAFYHMFVSNSW